MTMYAVAGTQADQGKEKENQLMVMKLSSLAKMDRNEESSSDEESDDGEEDFGEANPIEEDG